MGNLWHSYEYEEERKIRNDDGTLKQKRHMSALKKDQIVEKRTQTLLDNIEVPPRVPKSHEKDAMYELVRQQRAARRSVIAPYAQEIKSIEYGKPVEVPDIPHIDLASQQKASYMLQKTLSLARKLEKGHTLPSSS